RREKLDKFTLVSGVASFETQYRNVLTGFGELRLPIVSAANRISGIEDLELSAAERVARYSDTGTVTTPSMTATWSPAKGLRFRATDARIFKAPTLGDLSTALVGSEITAVPDSRSPVGQSLALVAIGGNPDLRPERGRSWSLGVDFSPERFSGLTIA